MSSADVTVYEQCYQANDGNEALLLQCITVSFEKMQKELQVNGFDKTMRSFLLVICGGMVFFMQAGFAMVCAGSVRKKNVVNTMLKNLLDACAAAIAFYTIGFGLAYGGEGKRSGTTFAGNENFFGHGVEDFGFWFFQFTFSAASVTIVAGTVAERSKMNAYFCYSIFLTAFIYPVVAHALWSTTGFLSPFHKDPVAGVGVIDAAGSGAVHLTGGVTALVATFVLGARQGRFHDEDGVLLENPQKIRGHSMALQLLGTFILWFGWYGFNGGSALLLDSSVDTGTIATRSAVNTTMSAAVGALTALLTSAVSTGSEGLLTWDLPNAMNGALCGLVSITSGCFTMDCWGAGLTGVVAGFLFVFGSHLLVRFRIDDAVDAVPVHLFGGAWGLIATGLFSDPDLVEAAFLVADKGGFFYELGKDAGGFDASLLSAQFYGLVFISGWTCLTTIPFFIILNWLGWFRVDKFVEISGLDANFHGADEDRLGQAELRAAIEKARFSKDRATPEEAIPAKSSNQPKTVSFG